MLSSAELRTLGEYLPMSFLTRTAFSREEIELGVPNSTSYKDYSYVYSTWLHEWCHHLQFVCTVIGHEYFFLMNIFGAIMSLLINRAVVEHGVSRLTRPLGQFLMTNVTDSNDVESIKVAVNAKLLVNMLLGTGKERHQHGHRFLPQPTSTAAPVVRVDGDEYMLGAQQIMEGHARANEILQLLLQPGLDIETLGCILDPLTAKELRDPYLIASEYVESQLGLDGPDYFLTALLCEMALNPVSFDLVNQYPAMVWEDIHLGWRFVKAVDYLVSANLRPRDANELRAIRISIETAMNWPGYAKAFPEDVDIFKMPFAADLRAIVDRNPLALAAPVLFMNDIMPIVPFSGGRHVPVKFKSVDLISGASNAEQFEGFRHVTTVWSQALPALLVGGTFSCPFHGTVFPQETKCKNSKCLFSAFFESIFGFTIAQWRDIPIRL